jgi:hypothetical protein
MPNLGGPSRMLVLDWLDSEQHPTGPFRRPDGAKQRRNEPACPSPPCYRDNYPSQGFLGRRLHRRQTARGMPAIHRAGPARFQEGPRLAA